jgi:hypothetical protein
VLYDSNMQGSKGIVCDGCGQPATQEHIARRLKRLEKMTRYRPIHVQTLFLAAASPAEDREELYSTEGEFQGEGAEILRSLGIDKAGWSIEEVVAGIQRQGLLFAHVLECPLNDPESRQEALRRRLPSVLARIRRSYKPKRVVLVGAELAEFVAQITNAIPDAMVVLRQGQPFEWSEIGDAVLPAMPVQAL